jgi:hypothetical protein
MSRQHMEPVVSLNGSASSVKPRSRPLQLGKKAGVQQTVSDVITPTAKKQIHLDHDRYMLHILQAVQHDTTGRRSLGQAFVQAWSTTAVVSASRIMACCLASKQRATRSFRQRNGPLVLVRGAA